VAACKKIALEEHFLAPGFDDYWKTSVTDVDPAVQRFRANCMAG
jgi:hypothetical protein